MTWLELVVYTLGAFRLVRLAGWDEITVWPRTIVTGISDRSYPGLAKAIEDAHANFVDPWDGHRNPPKLSKRRWYIAKLVRCPWCIGFWLSVLVAVCVHEWPHATFWVMLPLAISTVVGLVAKNLDP